MSNELYSQPETDVPMDEAKEVALWHDRISISNKAAEAWADDSGAKRFVKEYKGDYGIVFQTRLKKVPVPPINEVFSYVQSDIASVFNRDPYLAVNAKAGTVKGAALWEVILNYYWRILKTKEEMEYEIIDKDLVGFGWHKVGMAAQSIGNDDELKVDQKLYSKYLSWKDVVWNIGSKRPGVDSQWMAQRIVWPLDDIKAKFPNTAQGLEGSPNPEVNEDTYKKSAYKDDIKVGVMWEIWDLRAKKVRLVAEGLKDRYLEPPKDWPDYLPEFPFQMYWDFANPGSSRPMSSIAPWEPQILEKMVLMGSAINHAKRWNRQAFVKNGTIDDNALDKYERGDDGAIIVYNGEAADLKFADFGQLPTDFYLLMDRLDATMRNINGQPEFAKGGVTKTTTRTVGELQLIQQGNQSRQSRKVDRLETHCENIARHLMFHLKANFDFEEVARITGEVPQEIIEALGENFDPATNSVRFTPQEIEGEYDVDVKAGSTLPLDKQTRVQMMETILQSIAPIADRPMSNFMATLISGILKDYDIKSLDLAFQADLKAQQEKAQQEQGQQSVEDQKTQAETAKRAAQAQQIQVETEIAKLDQLKNPEHKVSESISIRDLPDEGKIQMAAQAGIHLSPGAVFPKPPASKNGGGE